LLLKGADLLQDDAGWTRERLMKAIESGTPQVVTLKRPNTVHLQCRMALVDETGKLNFFAMIFTTVKGRWIVP